MEVILSYLENMFLHMPKTPEVLRAKEELASMMEDKYNELLAEGKKENEAIGIVISEFGDLSELAAELGLGDSWSGKSDSNGTQSNGTESTGDSWNYQSNSNTTNQQSYGEAARVVTLDEAEEYIEKSVKSNRLVALGVMLCIYCPIPVLFLGGVDSYVKQMSDLTYVIMGILPLLAMVGIAVGLFIYSGSKMEKFEFVKKEKIQINDSVKNYLNEVAEENRSKYTGSLVFGVMMCIFSVVPVLIIGSLGDDTVISVLGVILLLVMVGIAVASFIIGGTKMSCVKALKQEGDFAPEKKEGNKVIDVIAGIYWPIVTVIYFVWSFTTLNWGFTWIVWPMAGILFGAIATICGVIGAAVKKVA